MAIQSSLLMPWVKPCNTIEEEIVPTEEVKLAAKKAIKVFANAGYHAAWWPEVASCWFVQKSELQALLFDLARVTKIENVKVAQDDMMQSLGLEV